jgi:hypothetical protein
VTDTAIERALAAGAFRYRRNVRQLAADQLAAIRRAIYDVLGLSDDRGLQHLAGIHGLPLPTRHFKKLAVVDANKPEVLDAPSMVDRNSLQLST